MNKIDYEIKVLVGDDRVAINRAIAHDMLYEPSEYTLEKHYVGSHFEVLADITDLADAERLLSELKNLKRDAEQ